MDPDIRMYNNQLNQEDQAICDMLAEEISQHLPDAENKIWHAHPVWFIEKKSHCRIQQTKSWNKTDVLEWFRF